jgi:hypothetical protein
MLRVGRQVGLIVLCGGTAVKEHCFALCSKAQPGDLSHAGEVVA